MSRRILVLGVVFVGFALILWSGYQKRFVRSAAPAAAQSVTFASASVGSAAPQDGDTIASPLLGQPAPDFTLRDVAGQSVRLANYRGKAVLINFWATWCAPCRVEMPWFIALRRQYGVQGFEILGIDKDFPEDIAKVPAFASKMRLSYPVLYGNGRVYGDYGCCDYLPMSFYIDRSGTIRSVTIGLGSRDEVERNIRRVLESSPSRPPSQIIASSTPTPAPP